LFNNSSSQILAKHFHNSKSSYIEMDLSSCKFEVVDVVVGQQKNEYLFEFTRRTFLPRESQALSILSPAKIQGGGIVGLLHSEIVGHTVLHAKSAWNTITSGGSVFQMLQLFLEKGMLQIPDQWPQCFPPKRRSSSTDGKNFNIDI
jgi:hypothetical protein